MPKKLPHLSSPPSAPAETMRGTLLAMAAPIASLVALGLWAVLDWSALPGAFPVHWGVNGADGWVATSPRSIAVFLALHAVVCLLFALIAWGVLYRSRLAAPSGARAPSESVIRQRAVRLLLVVEYFIAFPAWMGLMRLPVIATWIWALGLLGTVIVLTMSLIQAGLHRARLVRASGWASRADRSDDRYRRLGRFYINRADPAFLIERPFGIGYTLNLGHPLSWALVGILVIIPLLGWLL